jgi:hypothetical protein
VKNNFSQRLNGQKHKQLGSSEPKNEQLYNGAISNVEPYTEIEGSGNKSNPCHLILNLTNQGR